MTNDNFITSLGEIAKPATVLIEKISDAVGILAKPWQIKREAQAEAEAAKILVKAEVKCLDIRKRALTRFIQEETLKQYNIESIIRKSFSHLNPKSNPADMDNDWLMHFFDKSKIVSDEEMQNLWAQILAGESNAPGAYSKRTIELLSMLNKQEAFLFMNLCAFSFQIGKAQPLIFDFTSQMYNEKNINFNSLTHLDNIGLINFNNVADYKKIKIPKKITISYFRTKFNLEFKEEKDNQLPTGKVLLTQAGEELACICNPEPVHGFDLYVKETWERKSIKVTVESISP